MENSAVLMFVVFTESQMCESCGIWQWSNTPKSRNIFENIIDSVYEMVDERGLQSGMKKSVRKSKIS